MSILTKKLITKFEKDICGDSDFMNLLSLSPSQIHTVGMVVGMFKVDFASYKNIINILLEADSLKLSNIITRLPHNLVKDVIHLSSIDLIQKLHEHLLDQYQYNTVFNDIYRYNDVLCTLGNRLVVLKVIGYDTDDMLCHIAYYTSMNDYEGKGRALYNNILSITNFNRWINYRKLTNSL